ncbi:hypothetical protein ACFLTT_03505 [Chloroflexota bacterium]
MKSDNIYWDVYLLDRISITWIEINPMKLANSTTPTVLSAPFALGLRCG